MALTYTPRIDGPLQMPAFSAPTVFGETFTSQTLINSNVKVVVFICGHCPYVLAIENRLIETAKKIAALGGQFVAICSNDPEENPEDTPAALAKRAKEKNYPFPYLIDASQAIAKEFGAVCTPD